MPDPGKNLPSFVNPSWDYPNYFIADPRDQQKFYIVNPSLNIVTSFRDLFEEAVWYGMRNSNGLYDFEYPAQKPAHAFRVLFCGDSRSCAVENYPYKNSWNTQIWNKQLGDRAQYPPRQLSISKRMELELNTLASLDDLPVNFEVLSLFHNANDPHLFLWPTYEVPDAVKKNDIDLVVIFQPPTVGNMENMPFLDYFYRPITPEGIPAGANIDPEYLLKPPLERIPAEIRGNSMKFARLKI